MDEYLSKWEGMSAQLASMGAAIDEGLLTTMLVESFGARSDSEYGGALSALLTKDNLSWNQVSARLLQEYTSARAAGSSGSRRPTTDEALNTVDRNRGKKMKCWYCGKPGHRKADCIKRKRDEKNGKNHLQQRDSDDSALQARNTNRFRGNSEKKNSEEAVVDSGATAHMLKSKKWLRRGAREVRTSIGTAGKDDL